MAERQPDFGGYATKAGLRCTDGRVIQATAFAHMNGAKVPLVYMHGHSSLDNLLGYAVLEGRSDGVYAHGYFNDTDNGRRAKEAVIHGDLVSLSIYASGITEVNKNVSHGNIKEVSLVLSGANPGAKIDQVRIQHSADPDDFDVIDGEAIISHMGPLELPEVETVTEEVVEHADDEPAGRTIQEIFDGFDEEELAAISVVVGQALEDGNTNPSGENTVAQSESENVEGAIAHQEGTEENMGTPQRNVFEADARALTGTAEGGQHVISHSDIKAIFADGVKRSSFKEAINDYVIQHGITNIEVLFPDAAAITGTPEFDKRRTEWVSGVLAGVHKTPFAKLKTLVATLTQDEARAKGYIKGNYKIEEWFGVTKRTTGPTTVYKKQRLDRDDILDITDFNVVAWLMGEMRLMLEEEIARAILIGDGRSPGDVDKIKDPLNAASGDGIRAIYNEHELFATTLWVNPSAPAGTNPATNYEHVIDSVMAGMEYYKGSGMPTLYTTIPEINKFKMARDLNGRRYYETNAQVAEALGVANIVFVEPMKEVADLIGIIVNLNDYNVGTNKGGEITSFQDFDIDYNRETYLLETRLSGALLRIKSALIIRRTASANTLAVPVEPAFNKVTGVITIPTTTGVVYKDSDGTTTLSAGALTAIAAGETKTIYSVPASNYYFADTVNDSWPFTRNRA